MAKDNEEIAFEPGITQDGKLAQLIVRGAGLTLEIQVDTATHPYSEAEYPVCPEGIKHAITMLQALLGVHEIEDAPAGASYPIRPLPRRRN